MPSKRNKRRLRKKGPKNLKNDINNNEVECECVCGHHSCTGQEVKEDVLEQIKGIILMYHNKSLNKILSTQGWVLEQHTKLLQKLNKLFKLFNHNQRAVQKLGHCAGSYRNQTKVVAAGLHQIEHLVDEYDSWRTKLKDIATKCDESKEKLIDLLQPMMYEVLLNFYEQFESADDVDFDILDNIYQEIASKILSGTEAAENLLTDQEVHDLKEEIKYLNSDVEMQMAAISKKLWEVSFEYGIREPPARL